jgi:signal transduction histidine kinase
VLLGKVLAVLSIVALSTAGNVGSVLLTLLHAEATLGGGKKGSGIAFDWVDLALASPAIAVTAALAVALMILAALPATTFKQGQNLVSAISTLGMGGAVVGMLPTVDLDLTMAAVPLANAVLVLRDALAGELALAPTLVATAVNGTLAAIVLALAARVAGRETYLFGASLPRWLAPLRRSKAQ